VLEVLLWRRESQICLTFKHESLEKRRLFLRSGEEDSVGGDGEESSEQNDDFDLVDD
jgi:hypothetical protein